MQLFRDHFWPHPPNILAHYLNDPTKWSSCFHFVNSTGLQMRKLKKDLVALKEGVSPRFKISVFFLSSMLKEVFWSSLASQPDYGS